ncbi:hypothetical protein FJT64_017227 [Amphibalanus amphitrite]|uniref:Uncharacterized protein n=1 Tax=Amphibalanus amphitrite TaxID=1232801 RepID=A0A6A4WWV2_AMPAM|nr:hypothetical protein FJT64_017227 [Amphibalanus amphitrite]
MPAGRRCDDYRSLASTRYLQQAAHRLDSSLRERAGLVPSLGAALLLLVGLGGWLWGRCLIWPQEEVLGPGPPDAPLAANGTALWGECLRSRGSALLLAYVLLVLTAAVAMVVAVRAVPRLRRQLEVARRLLRADSAGCPPLPLTDVIQAVEAADMAEAERLIGGGAGQLSRYGALRQTVLTVWAAGEV